MTKSRRFAVILPGRRKPKGFTKLDKDQCSKGKGTFKGFRKQLSVVRKKFLGGKSTNTMDMEVDTETHCGETRKYTSVTIVRRKKQPQYCPYEWAKYAPRGKEFKSELFTLDEQKLCLMEEDKKTKDFVSVQITI